MEDGEAEREEGTMCQKKREQTEAESSCLLNRRSLHFHSSVGPFIVFISPPPPPPLLLLLLLFLLLLFPPLSSSLHTTPSPGALENLARIRHVRR